ncbi:hypothetical protein V6N11_068392 [Hibiscus sabdariffa]|uniref:Uncharacterized protein n=2 Tax=Hibiscus sabdariffa TaxID=183260 RepID=A0ABR2A2U9_9ROSI
MLHFCATPCNYCGHFGSAICFGTLVEAGWDDVIDTLFLYCASSKSILADSAICYKITTRNNNERDDTKTRFNEHKHACMLHGKHYCTEMKRISPAPSEWPLRLSQKAADFVLARKQPDTQVKVGKAGW